MHVTVKEIEQQGRKKVIKCTCDCGKEITVENYTELSKKQTFCDCKKGENRLKDIGKTFNKLTIVSEDVDNIRNVIVKCECGNTKSVGHSNLIRSTIKSCGCISQVKDVVGEVYNRFTIIENLPSKKRGNHHYKMVKARCECGIEKEHEYKAIKKGKVKSCGCLAKEQKLDITKYNKYGHWTIIEEADPYLDNKGNTYRKVKAECVCGEVKDIILNSIVRGSSTSCGCKNRVEKEEKIIIPIPTDTEEEQWKPAYGFEGYYISSKGNVFSTRGGNKYLNTKNKTLLDLNSNKMYRNFNISTVLYKSFYGDWNSEEYTLIFIDDDRFNCTLDNLFLARITNRGINWISRALANMRSNNPSKSRRSKKRTLTKRDIVDLYKKQEGLSYYLKIPMDLTGEDKLTSISIDRIDNDLDYIKGNVVMVTRFENMGRRDATFEHMVEFCNKLKCIGTSEM